MPKVEAILYFVLPKDDTKAQIAVRAARLVNTAPVSSLIEAIQSKYASQLPGLASGKRVKMFVEVDPSSILADYDVRDGDTVVLWVERPEELVEPVD